MLLAVTHIIHTHVHVYCFHSQGRLFSYADTHRHRLGTNYHLLPVNQPKCKVANYQRDGPMCLGDNQGGAPNYFPNSFQGPADDRKHNDCKWTTVSHVIHTAALANGTRH